jgi:hypothetical protein
MKALLWILLAAGLNGLMAWVVFSRGAIKDPFALFLLLALFMTPNIGTIWMLYVVVRFEKHPLPFILLGFIPYAFLWYYFQRVRLRKHRTREEVA